MSRTAERAAGSLLVAPLLIGILAVILMVVSGAAAGFRPIVGGSLASVAPYAATFRLLILLFIISWIVQLLGFALLTRLLARAGEEPLAILTFTLIFLSVITAVLNFSFRMTVELWAAQEAAQGGSLPAFYEPLRTWTSDLFGVGYRIHFVAMAGVGWAILRSGLLARGLGWASMVWSALWLFGALAGLGAPAVPILMPAVLGVALLMKGTGSGNSRTTAEPS